MKDEPIKVSEIPESVEFNTTFEIESKGITDFTHGFFKYPCKFIPHIPRWAIKKYTKLNDIVLDPFAGSGTTLVESVLLGRNALGVDFDKLSQLLSKTKTQWLIKRQREKVIEFINKLDFSTFSKNGFSPDLQFKHIRYFNELSCFFKIFKLLKSLIFCNLMFSNKLVANRRDLNFRRS